MNLGLLHSPFLRPSTWGKLPAALEELGHRVTVLDADDTATPGQYAHAAHAQLPPEPLVLVAHSGAGVLVPAVAARRDHTWVNGAVFVDATLPGISGESRLASLKRRRPEAAVELATLLYAGGSWPDPTADGWRDIDVHPRDLTFFSEPVAVPSAGWGGLRWAYLRTSESYETEAAAAQTQGRPVLRTTAGHFAAAVAPDETAAAIHELVAALNP